MLESEFEKYLGDLISKYGDNNETVKDRCRKGTAQKAQIVALLKEISLGCHYFSIGLLFRETNVVNSILFNTEVWHNLKMSQIEM